jgi:hypothetical protein
MDRIMAQIGVHRPDDLETVIQTVKNPGCISVTEPALTSSALQLKVRTAFAKSFHDVTSAVGRIVVDDEHVHVVEAGKDLAD